MNITTNRRKISRLIDTTKITILVVDDQPNNLRFLSNVLMEQGYKVQRAISGELALTAAITTPPDLILLDIMMPEMNGYEVCQRLKATAQTQDIPIIFLSALSEGHDKVKGFQVGGVDYITKPFYIEEVLVRIENQLTLQALQKNLQEQNTLLQREIRDRQQKEEALRQSKHFIEQIAEATPSILYLHDLREQRNIYANCEIALTLGYTPEAVQKMGCEVFPNLMHPEDLEKLPAYFKQFDTAKDGDIFEIEYRMRDANGNWCWLNSRDTVFARTADGKPLQILGIATDITTRKQAENEIRLLLATTQAVNGADELTSAMDVIVRLICQTIGWDVGEAWIPADEGTVLNYGAGCYGGELSGEEFQHYRETFTLDAGVELPEQVWLSGQPEWIEAVGETKMNQESPVAVPGRFQTGFGVPIADNKQVLAVLVFYNRTQCLPNPHLLALVQAVAAQLGALVGRKLTEAALRISEERLQLALEGSALGLWDWNIGTGQTYYDPQWKKILGYEVNEIENTYQSWEQLLHPEDKPRVMERLSAYLEGRSIEYDVECRMLTKSGGWKWIAAHGNISERDEAGNPLRMTGTNKDISDRKQSDEALRESETREREKAQQLEQTLRELQCAQAQLVQSQKLSGLGRMVAGVAHEINNPVNFIYGNLIHAKEYFQNLLRLIECYQQIYPQPTPEIQALSEEIDLEFLVADWKQLMNSMEVGAERIHEIVRSLQLFSRQSESQLNQPVDIHEGIDNTLLILQHRLRAQGDHPPVEVLKNYGQLPKVTCNASQLNQVFMNLLSNALDALEQESDLSSPETQTRRRITIHTSVKPETSPSTNPPAVVIQIADNGSGMSEEVCQQIFDPFFSTKSVGKGTGLGLSISYQIVVEKHGGNLRCVSALGKGTEFFVEIPVRPPKNAWLTRF
ncbi:MULTISPECIES: PAS domain-containing protein [unclassified Coleofasciculus]|uniref:PAS domain-containing protein n=1 Tax=unclassified Coleofasciculus TaxID=2692782 RepID=UPI00187FA561|nr:MULTISPECIES: PAS domain-containing protein [unclassified Coleofasciculus]MBE9129573.1 PAS domain-containing protein [Coleofasciculus sp. LEGE 07081]MBE9152138.1 PAS domain-containing protein [Coleofasciculus sp. LEGE 07092]